MNYIKRFFVLGALALAILVSRPAAANTIPNDVLILNSYHAGYSWTDEMVNGIRETLHSGGFAGEPMVEYMDWKRLPFAENLVHLRRLFAYKYGHHKLSVVFVTDNAAMDFALRYRDELFPGAKIVFCGINGYTETMIAGRDYVTGVVEDVDVPGTVEVALRLHPHAKEVLVIFDGTESAQAARNTAAKKMSDIARRVKIHYMDAPEVSEIETVVKRLTPDTIIVQGTYSRDRSGRVYNIDDVVKRIAPHSPAPVYGLWEAMVGKGILGGSLLSGRIQGETAGRLGLRILNGEEVARIPVILKTPMVQMFDYQQLKRFDVDPALLPTGALVINRPFSFYETYRYLIWSVVGVICLLSAIIGALLFNISARRRAEAALFREKNYIEQIISVAPTMICTVAEDGTTLSVNKAVTNVTGYSPEELVGQQWWRHFPSVGDQQAKDLVKDLRQGPVLDLELPLVGNGGQKRIVSMNLVARVNKEKDAFEIIGIGADITERKQAEEEREHFLRELEQKNKELESIVYVASHDLRTPLVNIQGFSRKLSRACDNLKSMWDEAAVPAELRREAEPVFRETIPKSIHFITTSVEKMDTLLGGLLRLSRLGREALTIERLDMNALIESIVSSMAYQIQNAGGTMVVAAPLSSCFGDPIQINQVFSNLIDNAIKYRSADRPLRINVSSLTTPSEIIYRIEDNGIGIPSMQQNKIWEIFHRLNPESDIEGEGLGLTMARRILDRCNGRIWVESAPGTGSLFFVALPTEFTSYRAIAAGTAAANSPDDACLSNA